MLDQDYFTEPKVSMALHHDHRLCLSGRGLRRRGSVLVLGLILTIGVISVAALSLDLGYVRLVQLELRRSADAVAMAGCWDLFEQYQYAGGSEYQIESIHGACNEIAHRNSVGETYAALDATDLQVGRYELDGSWTTNSGLPANAVQVVLRRDESVNGELPLFFAALTGRSTQQLQVSATAAFFQTIEGFYVPDSGESLNVLPIALDLETWLSAINDQTEDDYQFQNGTVQIGGDGISEANLYPQGTGSPGNRGTVDIGGADNSTSDLSRQILHGVSRQDLVELGKPLLFDENGELELNGDTGISAGIKDELSSIIGEVRIIPIYSGVSGNGNNATYTIVRWEGVRVLDVKLTGKKSSKRVMVQPQRILARNARIDYTGSNLSTHLYTPVLLVE